MTRSDSDPSGADLRPVAVTVGDVCGVGPELIWRVLGGAEEAFGPCIVYGDPAALEGARRSLMGRFPELASCRVLPEEGGHGRGLRVRAVDVDRWCGRWAGEAGAEGALPGEGGEYPWGSPNGAVARLQMAALRAAIADARAGRVRAVVTAPWNKGLLARGGLPPTGHTEVLAAEGGSGRALMVLAGDVVRVALVTAHLPLVEVPAAVTREAILETGRMFAEGLRTDFALASPRIAVCGLNPHAGEGGVLGREEGEIIAPAVEALRAAGVDASGPWPADTLFPRVAHGSQAVDGVLAMYHDQGLVGLKTAHFGASANITFGLPFVRTSVDHGTAYDIAGRGEADPSSFRYALSSALRLSANRRRAEREG